MNVEIDPSRTAFLALHFERDVIEDGRAFGTAFAPMIARDGVLANTARALDAARAAGMAVVYARIVVGADRPDLPPTTPLNRAVLDTGSFKAGTPGTEIVEDVAPHDGDLHVEHASGTSAFVGGGLEAILAQRAIETVICTGVATNVIVEGTARDANNRGLGVYVLSDCTAAADDAARSASLKTLELVCNGVLTSDELIQALRGVAA